jgi:N-acyl-L-homoserine lactone synthetase
MVYYFKHVTDEKEKEELFRLRYRVYCEEKEWFDKADYEKKLETDIYDQQSALFSAGNSDGDLVGCIRLILPSPENQLQIYAHPSVKEADLDLAKCAEVSRHIVVPGHSTGDIMIGLVRILHRYIIDQSPDLEYLLIGALDQNLRILRGVGYDFIQFGEPAICYNDLIITAKMNLQVMEEHLKENAPSYYRWIHQDPTIMDGAHSLLGFIKDKRKKEKKENQL